MQVLGVDGAPGGWVGAAWDGTSLRLFYRCTMAELAAAAGPVAMIGVDIPIGLIEAGTRRADAAARAFLGPRRSAVFLTPIRAVLEDGEFTDYAAANRLARARSGKGLSRQAFALLPKIAEVARWQPNAPAPVAEIHPEVAFQLLAGAPLPATKKTWVGAGERRRLLAGAGLHPDPAADCGPASVDDVLDACVVAWSAQRVARGQARCFPPDPAPGEPTIQA